MKIVKEDGFFQVKFEGMVGRDALMFPDYSPANYTKSSGQWGHSSIVCDRFPAYVPTVIDLLNIIETLRLEASFYFEGTGTADTLLAAADELEKEAI